MVADAVAACLFRLLPTSPNSKVHVANMVPTWGRQDPGGPHVGPMNFAIWEVMDDLILVFQAQLY